MADHIARLIRDTLTSEWQGIDDALGLAHEALDGAVSAALAGDEVSRAAWCAGSSVAELQALSSALRP